MERESNPMEALCRSGCGFYGNPSTDGLCSVCFKEALKKKQQPPATTPSPVSAAFVPAPAPAPAPTPLAAAAPTVPSLPAQSLLHADVRNWRRKAEQAQAARVRARPTQTRTTRTPARTRRKRIGAPSVARRLDSQGSSAAAEGYSARCTGTAISTTARSTTGSWARRRSAATTPSSSRRRYTRYEPPRAPSAPRAPRTLHTLLIYSK